MAGDFGAYFALAASTAAAALSAAASYLVSASWIFPDAAKLTLAIV